MCIDMFFKKLRSHSKSSSKSTKPDMTRITSTSSSAHECTVDSKIPAPPLIAQLGADGKTPDAEQGDYDKFLEQAKKDAEKAEKLKLKELQEAERRKREVNLSPWAGRM